MEDQDPVQLGFSVPYDDYEHEMVVGHKSPLWNDWDGGIIGGKPSWLNPRDLPQNFLTCKNCQKPLRFLCQLYAPADEINDNAFHRSIYVWGCTMASCAKRTSGSIRVLRAQLAIGAPRAPSRRGRGQARATACAAGNGCLSALIRSSWCDTGILHPIQLYGYVWQCPMGGQPILIGWYYLEVHTGRDGDSTLVAITDRFWLSLGCTVVPTTRAGQM